MHNMPALAYYAIVPEVVEVVQEVWNTPPHLQPCWKYSSPRYLEGLRGPESQAEKKEG